MRTPKGVGGVKTPVKHPPSGAAKPCEFSQNQKSNAAKSRKFSQNQKSNRREVLAENQFDGIDNSSDDIANADEEIAVAQDESDTPVVQAERITLKNSLEIAANSTRKEKINKKYIADYLKKKFGKEVGVHRRANSIKSGKLPLADTHYVL